MQQKFRLAIIGAGLITENAYLPAALASEAITVEVIVDPTIFIRQRLSDKQKRRPLHRARNVGLFMLRAGLAALLIAMLTFASSALAGGPYLPSGRGQGGGGGTDNLETLIANAGCHDCWFKISSNSFTSLLNSYGYTMANYDGAIGDAWTTDAGVQTGSAGGGVGIHPGTDADVTSYSAATIRQSDGKVCYIATGGHFASGVSTAFCLDLISSAATCNTSTFLCNGQWQIATRPGRLINGYDTKPSGTPQGYWFSCMASWTTGQSSPATLNVTGCVNNLGNNIGASVGNFQWVENGDTSCLAANTSMGTVSLSGGAGTINVNSPTTCGGTNVTIHFNPRFWYRTNESSIGAGDGVLMPSPCHAYFTGIAIPGTTKWSSDGVGCGSDASQNQVGLYLFDDSSNAISFPVGTIGGYAQGGQYTTEAGVAYDDLDGCLYTQADDKLNKICNPLSPSATRTHVATATDGANIYLGFTEAIIIPDPVSNPSTQRAFYNFRDHFASGQCRSGQTFGCFELWHGLNGTPQGNDIIGAWNSALPAAFDYFTVGSCWNASANKILFSVGGKAIYQVNIAGAPTVNPATSGWSVSQWNGTATGVTPAASQESQQVRFQCLQPRYAAEVLTQRENVYLHID